VKFRDVELVGIPLRVTVGTRGLADGVVELTERVTGQTESVVLSEIVERARKAIDATN
jgi:prolyl-tRNA synthetase